MTPPGDARKGARAACSIWTVTIRVAVVQSPDVSAFAGLALIFAGLAAVDGRLFARLARRRR